MLSFLRAVPDVNTGVMGKLWVEAMEEIDRGPRDALRVGGASGLQAAAHAVLPAVVPQLAGLLLYRFDVNVRSSLVLGPVGAGGIGFLVNRSIKLFRFDEMVTHLAVVMVLVVAVDQHPAYVRRRVGASWTRRRVRERVRAAGSRVPGPRPRRGRRAAGGPRRGRGRRRG
ncbi:PhnE/PtxC family ABC transporter permease [Nonomuraea sp. NPDC050783]|uniref:PhnE/PtxC family ABC transporter permease n=1 Tax=Nonomuraea sp. NPDC050783 TaxID=3154634 RepID=UPI0034651895